MLGPEQEQEQMRVVGGKTEVIGEPDSHWTIEVKYLTQREVIRTRKKAKLERRAQSK